MRKISQLLTVIILTAFVLVGCMQTNKKPATPSPNMPNTPKSKMMKEEPTISLYVKETGKVKKIKLEEYLQGVVAAEMDPKWGAEALRAQAILARTFTLKKMEQGGVKARGTDASTDIEEFQAYDEKRINQAVKNAVASTKGEVITYQGKYILAWFFADGGGKTAASAQEGLDFNEEPTPYIHSVNDPGTKITVPENKSWKAEFPMNMVQKAVQEVTGKPLTKASSAKIIKKGASGRATEVQIGDQKVSAPALRLKLGNDKMLSYSHERMDSLYGSSNRLRFQVSCLINTFS
jgi:stage II sporulation protein D